MSFYHFDQNNSGGHFTINDRVSMDVWIEAPDSNSAEVFATEHGIYFNGCSEGSDCNCCGDRWYPPSKGNEILEHFGRPLIKIDTEHYTYAVDPDTKWPTTYWSRKGEAEGWIHFQNGNKARVDAPEGARKAYKE